MDLDEVCLPSCDARSGMVARPRHATYATPATNHRYFIKQFVKSRDLHGHVSRRSCISPSFPFSLRLGRNQFRMRIAKPIEQLGLDLRGELTDFFRFAIGDAPCPLIVADIAFLSESIYLSDQPAAAT